MTIHQKSEILMVTLTKVYHMEPEFPAAHHYEVIITRREGIFLRQRTYVEVSHASRARLLDGLPSYEDKLVSYKSEAIEGWAIYPDQRQTWQVRPL